MKSMKKQSWISVAVLVFFGLISLTCNGSGTPTTQPSPEVVDQGCQGDLFVVETDVARVIPSPKLTYKVKNTYTWGAPYMIDVTGNGEATLQVFDALNKLLSKFSIYAAVATNTQITVKEWNGTKKIAFNAGNFYVEDTGGQAKCQLNLLALGVSINSLATEYVVTVRPDKNEVIVAVLDGIVMVTSQNETWLLDAQNPEWRMVVISGGVIGPPLPLPEPGRLLEDVRNGRDIVPDDYSECSVPPAEEITLGLSLSTLNNPFFVTLRDGAQAAADQAGVELVVVDAQDDSAKEATNIELLILGGVSALLINPTDSDAIVPLVQKANAADIPVFTVDRMAYDGVIISHIASDNVAGGSMAAKFLCEALQGAGKVVELEGIAGTSTARDRGQGFNDYMSKECSGVEIVARQTANFNRAEGLNVFENILQAQPVINGTFAHNDEMVLGAIEAAEAAERSAEIVFVGFDAIDDAVNAVEAGRLAATIAQQPSLMGQLGVEVALRSLGCKTVDSYIPVDLSLVRGTLPEQTEEPTEEPPAPTEDEEKPYEGESVSIFTAADEQQTASFQAEFDDFTAETGIEVVVEGSPDFEVLALTRAEAGDAPDIINFPQPGLMTDFAKSGFLVDLGEFLSDDYMQQQYAQTWIDNGTVDGKLVGIWHNADIKSLVWYAKPAFEEAGYEIPQTWDELLALSDQIVADGGVPWCIGFESGSATGWPGTDWIEDIMLRTASPEDYDAWTRGELKFSSDIVKNAWETAANIWLNPDYVLGGTTSIFSLWGPTSTLPGGTTSILTVNFGDSPLPLVEDPPGCFMHRQASFIVNFFPEDTVIGEDVDYFYLPPINEADYGKPVLGSGSLLSMGQDTPAVREVMKFLTTADSVKVEVQEGLFVAPQKDVPQEWYPNETLAGFAEILANADTFRFDGSDLMPGAVGAGSFWTGVVDFVSGKDLDYVLWDIDYSWPTE